MKGIKLSNIIIALVMAIFPFSLFANQKVETPDFDFPKEVSEKATADLAAALKANNGEQMIDALVRYGIAEGNISQENLPAIINKIESVLKKEQRPDFKALLLALEAKVFRSYSNAYAGWRKTSEAARPADYSEWGRNDFNEKFGELMSEAVKDKDALRKCAITDYANILKYNELGAIYQPTLYDFLLAQKSDFVSLTTEEETDQCEYLLRAGYVPAYLYSKSQSRNTAEKLKLYEQYKDNEHSGCLLADQFSTPATYALLKDYLQRFPNGVYAYQVGSKIAEIEHKKVNISHQNSSSSRDSIQVECRLRNVNDFSISVYQVPDSYLKALEKRGETNIDTKKCKLIGTYDKHVDGAMPSFTDSVTTAVLNPLPHGQYALVVSFRNGGKTIESTSRPNDMLLVYDIASFTVAREKKETRIFAADRTTGAPMKGVSVKGENIDGVTAADGSCALPLEFENDREVLLSKGTDKYAPKVSLYQFDDTDNIQKSMSVYTDLAIYRPGETIKFAAVLYRVGTTSRTVASGEAIEVELKDTNYKSVKKLKLTSDAFGRIDGEFTVPTDRMNGRWMVNCSGSGFYGRRYVDVSEYKTPTFAVEFPDVSHNFVSKQPVKITGTATTYSGMPIANTEVKLTLAKREWSWYWRYQSEGGTTLNDTTVATDADGRFAIEYPAGLFGEEVGKYTWDWCSYTLSAKVTTAAGESQEGYHSFVVGRIRSIEIRDFTHENSKKAKLPVIFNSTDDADKSLVCTYTLKDENGNVVKASSFKTDALEADFSEVPSGVYTIEVQVADEPNITSKAEAIIYRSTDKRAPVKDCAIWIPTEAYRVDSKNVAHATIGVSAPESHIYYVAQSRAGVVKEGWLHYKQGLHDFALQIPNAPDEYLSVQFINVYKGEVNRPYHKFISNINEQKLNIKLNSFRDKLVPGEKEKWTMQFVDKNGNPVQTAMMLEMYDKALESLSSNKWNIYAAYLDARRYAIGTSFYVYSRFLSASYQDEVKIKGHSPQWPEFNMYGQHFFPQFLVMESAPVIAYGSAMKMSAKSQGVLEESKVETIDRANADDRANAELSKESKAEEKPQLNDIKLREADIKTALWKPMLTSDTGGNLVVEFEAPEFNTTWVMQAIAYTGNMVSNTINREVLTQKPIMVKSSLPRFVRAGDKAVLKASVMNATDEATTYSAIVELFNPRTQEVVATKNFEGNIAAKGTEVVGIEFAVPDTIPFVGFRVKAANTTFGDGEQVMLPVLSDIAPVIETEPFFVDAAMPHFEMKMPSFPLDSRVTLEYCDNPVWYCVTALPTIYEPNYHIATSLAHNLFAEVLAQGVAKSNPLIKTAIQQWTADGADSTLTSMLEKNKDLKTTDLLASPWVNEADRQSLRMSKLIELFDEKKMGAEHKKIVGALQKLQRADGGFPWYEYNGCRSSLWTSEVVLELIGELQHMGYTTDDADINTMLKKALAYYDKEMLKLWNEQQKINKKNYSGFSSYVYVRSLFPGVKLPSGNDKMMKKALSAMTKDWKGLPMGEKAYFAMALNRGGYRKVASRIVESLRQFAIVKPELGMYWDNLQVGWRYFDKVAVTATILEAMHEVGASQTEIDQIRKWILLMKQSNDWGSSSLAADAVYAILSTGSQWLERSEKPSITINGEAVQFSHIDEYVGYCRKTIPAKSGATLKIERKGTSPAWGAVYCQYKAPMASVEAKDITEMSIRKEYLVYGADAKLIPATDGNFKVGDKVQVRVVIKNNKDLDFVTVTDQCAACFEPKDQLSGSRYMDGTYFFQETKDAQTNLFFTSLGKGTHIISYDVYVTAEGSFSAGIATAQCQYAPQLSAHSSGTQITVQP